MNHIRTIYFTNYPLDKKTACVSAEKKISGTFYPPRY